VGGNRNIVRDSKKMLSMTYRFLRAIGYKAENIRVLYAKGDSPSGSRGSALKILEQQSLSATLEEAEKQLGKTPESAPAVRVTWGADELMLLAFASALPTQKVIVKASEPTAPMHYEDNTSITSVVNEKLLDAGLVGVTEISPADFKLAIHSKRVSSASNADDTFDPFPNDPNVAYVDKRYVIGKHLANGAYNYSWAPLKRCNSLAYAAWGTAANSVGSALATAKILTNNRNEIAKQELLLEAIAHDAIFIGWASRDWFLQRGYKYSSETYYNPTQIENDFKVGSSYIQQEIAKLYQGTDCITGKNVVLKPQLNRFFEGIVDVN
jgi:hypothetical protein